MKRLPGETRQEMADRWLAEQPARVAARKAQPRVSRAMGAFLGALVLVAVCLVAVAAAVLIGWVLYVGVFAAWERIAALAVILALGGLVTRHR